MSGSDPQADVDALEEAGRYEDAIVALDRLAAETGEDVRWHVAWMHTRAGNAAAADEIWTALRAERPGDPGLPYLEAAALLEDDRHDEALPLLAESLDLGLSGGSDETLLRRVADERLETLRARGRPPEDVDHRAREALARHAPAVAWFDRDAFADALASWGSDFAGGASDYSAYVLGLERQLRDGASGVTGRNPRLVAIGVHSAQAFAADNGWQPDWPVTHDQVAAAALRDDAGRGVPWPPGRNDACWCGSGAKYKRCCGR